MTRAGTRPVTIPLQETQTRQPHVTVGTDGSEWGDVALDWALRHASTLKATIHVYAAECAGDQTIARRLHAYRWLHATVTASPDSPVQALVAASAHSDLLVLGYRGHHHGPFGLGRSITPILTGTHCDTVVVRGEIRAVRREYGWVTAAIGGAHDPLVLQRAAQAATRSRSRLRLVHAVPLPAARHVETDDPAKVLERAADMVRGLAPDITPSLLLTRSQPHEAIRATTRSDLLVIGPGNQNNRLSMVASTALHLAPCPVLVVKPD
ncbi:universal stress protein [Actinocrispum wychmicini]|uniref:Universal stress protein family protein n=1 Tax=Actinocrispum wychmicini TaxID=1213861 RepID=A0A4R2JR66_9PSEU|nr:universal stress protein [Actinocrispum wychmicini]TCO61974.1 universal stress protein family protein [Actinocrispum wychmicini]